MHHFTFLVLIIISPYCKSLSNHAAAFMVRLDTPFQKEKPGSAFPLFVTVIHSVPGSTVGSQEGVRLTSWKEACLSLGCSFPIKYLVRSFKPQKGKEEFSNHHKGIYNRTIWQAVPVPFCNKQCPPTSILGRWMTQVPSQAGLSHPSSSGLDQHLAPLGETPWA